VTSNFVRVTSGFARVTSGFARVTSRLRTRDLQLRTRDLRLRTREIAVAATLLRSRKVHFRSPQMEGGLIVRHLRGECATSNHVRFTPVGQPPEAAKDCRPGVHAGYSDGPSPTENEPAKRAADQRDAVCRPLRGLTCLGAALYPASTPGLQSFAASGGCCAHFLPNFPPKKSPAFQRGLSFAFATAPTSHMLASAHRAIES
jgi:hypothetical protein